MMPLRIDRKSTRLNSSHVAISYAVFCLKKKKQNKKTNPHSLLACSLTLSLLFFFNAPAPTEIYTLSLHDALPIYGQALGDTVETAQRCKIHYAVRKKEIRRGIIHTSKNPLRTCEDDASSYRSEEHTSELQSRGHLVCRLLLEKKKTK